MRAAAFAFLLLLASASAAEEAVLTVGEGRQPSLAVSPSGIAWVAWATPAGEVYAASLEPKASAFSKPVLVAKEPDLALGMRRGPRIAVTDKGLAVTLARARFDHHARKVHGDQNLVCYRSEDGGKAWQGPARVNALEGSCGEGLQALAAGSSGEITVAWMSQKEGGGENQELLFAVSKDLGKTFSKPAPVLSGAVCPCCHPSLAAGPDGKLSAMWRGDVAGCRDMQAAFLDPKTGKFDAPKKLGEGSWPIRFCPMDGGGIALGKDGTPASAWRRDRQVFATLGDGKEILLGTGKDPVIASGPSGTLALWVNMDAIQVRKVDGADPARRLADPPAGVKQGCPVVSALPSGGFLAAWEDDGTVRAVRIP